MKHAINELQALLDTWGGQKEQSWRDEMKTAIYVLEGHDHGSVVYLEETGGVSLWCSSILPSKQLNEDDEPIPEGAVEKWQEEMYKKEFGSPEDDLGELDPDKACGSDGETCEACQ